MVMFTPLGRPPIWTPRPPTVPLTLSGNEITPYVRRFGREGDGLNPNEPLGKYSIGIEEATQNKVTQSIPGASATTNVTKAGDAAATLTLVADADRPFPNAAATVWELDNSAGSTDATVDFAGNTGNTNKHSVSIYAKKSAGTPTLSLEGAGGVNITQTSWTRSLSVNLTPGGSTENLRITAPAGAVVRFTAAQLEEQPLALSFVMTNGSAASRSAARIQLPNMTRYLTPTQGWVVAAFRAGFAYDTTKNPSFFTYGDDNNNSIRLDYLSASDLLVTRRAASGVSGQKGSVVSTHAVNDILLGVWDWTATALRASLNGAAFDSSTADTNIPTLTTTTADVFSGGTIFTGRQANSALLFFAMGKGTLALTDPVIFNYIARYNPIDSRPEDLPGGCTFKWPPADGDISRGFAA